jgi:hypothetical protein
MAGIALPGLDRLPAGPHRDLTVALHRLYRGAGKPGTRQIAQAVMEGDYRDTVSHETVAAMLRGDEGLPRWVKLEAVVRVLAAWNTPRLDPDAEACQVQRLWHAAQDRPSSGGNTGTRLAAEVHQPPPPGRDAVAEDRDPPGTGRAAWNDGATGESPPLILMAARLAGRLFRRRPHIGAGKSDSIPRMNPVRSRNDFRAAVTIAIVIAVTITAYYGWPRHNAEHRPSQAKSESILPALGPGASSGTIQIPVKSLSAELAANLGRSFMATGATVTGFMLRNAGGSGDLCLNANNTGFTAGRNGDAIQLWTCDSAYSEIWIPVQWERYGRKLTWLVNYEYQSKCLNADNIPELNNGHIVQLWDCYNGPNEYWDFGDWRDRANPRISPYPLFLGTEQFCLDADKYHMRIGDGDPVHIWTYYGPPNQLWS